MKSNQEMFELVSEERWDDIAATIACGEWQADANIMPPSQPSLGPERTRTIGFPLLYVAAEQGRTVLTRALLERKANPDTQINGGWTVLMTAIEMGHLAIVDLLLHAGANLHLKSQGKTALMIAAEHNHKDIIRRLLAAGARVADTGPKGMTALSYAATRGRIDPETVALLFEAGSPVDGRDLHVPIALREVETVRLLLSKAPDVNKRFDWPSFPLAHIHKGDTPLLVAVADTMNETFAKSGASFGISKPIERLLIVDLLLGAGADVNIPRLKTGATALILAAFFDEALLAERLIRAGADPNAEFECKMARFQLSRPRSLRDTTLSAVTMARMKPRNKKIRKLLLGEST